MQRKSSIDRVVLRYFACVAVVAGCSGAASAQQSAQPSAGALPATATEPALELAENKLTRLGLYLSAREAHELVKLNADKLLFLDVRSRAEVAFLGVPTSIDAHIPFMDMNDFGEWDARASTYKLEANTGFIDAINLRLKQKNLVKTSPIILICRSGDRSARAVNTLSDFGFTQVYSVTDGFEGDLSREQLRNVNGWKNSALPWQYKLEKSKAWLPGGG
jgi:rhodanese-related sulfurtransferase